MTVKWWKGNWKKMTENWHQLVWDLPNMELSKREYLNNDRGNFGNEFPKKEILMDYY